MGQVYPVIVSEVSEVSDVHEMSAEVMKVGGEQAGKSRPVEACE